MSYRDSVVVNVSYYYGVGPIQLIRVPPFTPRFSPQFNRLPQSPPSLAKNIQTDPAYVAASIVSTALEFRNLIIKGELIPEPAGKEGGELCMESFKWSVVVSPANLSLSKRC